MAVGIDDFSWDDFEEGVTTDNPPTEEDVVDKTTDDKDKKSKVEVDDDFAFEPLPVDTVPDDKGGTVVETGDESLLKTLKERELLTIELEEGEDLESAYVRQLENDVTEAVEQLFEGVKRDKEGIALLKHLRAGGSVDTFVKNSSFAIDIEVDTEDKQAALIKSYYVKRKGMDNDEVDDLIDTLKNNGKLEGRAENVKAAIEKERVEETANYEATKKANEKKAIENHKKLRESFTGIVRDTKFDFKGIGKDKDDTKLVDMLTKPVDNSGRTQFHQKLGELFLPDNHEKLLVVAKLLENGFNFDKLIKKGASQQVGIIKNKVENRSVSINTGNARKTITLADLID